MWQQALGERGEGILFYCATAHFSLPMPGRRYSLPASPPYGTFSPPLHTAGLYHPLLARKHAYLSTFARYLLPLRAQRLPPGEE